MATKRSEPEVQEKVVSQKKKTKAEESKSWSDEEVGDLIESKPCLWNIHDPSYAKRDEKELAYSSIAEQFETTIQAIKAKLNGLRTQFGREMSRERTTKSGQSTEELYHSSWVHFERLKFLVPIIGNSAKSRDILKDNDTDSEEVTPTKPKPQKKRSFAEKKLALLSKATKVIVAGPEKRRQILLLMSMRNCLGLTKQINDIIFELEFKFNNVLSNVQNLFPPYPQNFGTSGFNNTVQRQGQIQNSYVGMLNHES